MTGKKELQNISSIPEELCASLEYFFTDIDDTITDSGLINPGAFNILWALHEAGINVVPVTGRPAGWCDHIARMWPVAAVVGENGAFYFSYNRKEKRMRREMLLQPEDPDRGREKISALRRDILRQVPQAAISADQAYRIADLAVDFCEDVPPLSEDAVQKICRIAAEHGAKFKISSIHVNCWFADFDKLSCIREFLFHRTGKKTLSQNKIIYIGDSPNDEPMFQAFHHSIGVANILRFQNLMKYMPLYITPSPSGAGFTEAGKEILKKRKSG